MEKDELDSLPEEEEVDDTDPVDDNESVKPASDKITYIVHVHAIQEEEDLIDLIEDIDINDESKEEGAGNVEVASECLHSLFTVPLFRNNHVTRA